MASTSVVARNGDIIRWEIPIKNNGSSTDTSVSVTGVLPDGITITNYIAPLGTSFTGASNPGVSKWTVGTLAPGDTKMLIVDTVVNDITKAPFSWVLTVDGDNIDPTAGNNVMTLTVNSTTCPPQAGAVDDILCACGNVSLNDTACTQCDTKFVYDPLSLLNLTINNFDEDTGVYSATITDPTKPSEFKYSIWCRNCPDGNDYETSGPAKVTIYPQFSSWASDSLTDNGDGTYTHKDVSGTSVTFKAGWTTITKEANNSFTFTYPDGSTINYNFLNIENVTTLVDNSDGTHTYTSEDGTTTTFNTRFKDINIQKFLNLTSVNGDTVVSAIAIPSNEAYTHVFRNGLLQIKGVDYAVNGFNITFNETFGGSGGSTPENIVVHIYQE